MRRNEIIPRAYEIRYNVGHELNPFRKTHMADRRPARGGEKRARPGADLPEDMLGGFLSRTVPFSKRLEVAELADREFVIETRLVNREPLSAALKLRRRGWQVFMVYLALPRIDLCRARVRARVHRGGADVSDEVLEIGFRAALDNLPQYIDLAERWLIIDSSGARSPLIARGAHAAAVAAVELEAGRTS